MSIRQDIAGQVTVIRVQKPKKKKKKHKSNKTKNFWTQSKPSVARVFKAPKTNRPCHTKQKPSSYDSNELRFEMTKQLVTSHWLKRR